MTPIKSSHGIAILGACFLLTLLFINWAGKQIDSIALYIPPSSQTAAVSDFNSSLVAHYTFDDTANDSAGSNNGTVSGGATYVDGKIGRAMQFDGVDDTVNAGNVLNLGTGSMTASVWIKTSFNTRQVIVSKVGSKFYYLEILGNSTARFYISDGTNTHNPQFPISLSDGSWHHLAWVIDRSKTIGKFYFDGAEKTSNGNNIANLQSLGDITGTGNFYISGNGGSFFNGSIDDVRIYNRALTSPEITELFNLSSGGGTTSTTCTSFTYSTYGTCSNNTQTRTVTGSSPASCTGGTPIIAQSCTVSDILVPELTLLPAPDTTLPTILTASPSGSLSSDIINTTLSLSTNESATCKYSTVSGTSYASMSNTFSTTSPTSHSSTVSGLTSGSSYNYYVKCKDEADNITASDYIISFSIASDKLLQIDPLVDDDSIALLGGSTLGLTGQKDSATSFWNVYAGLDAPEGGFMGWINYGGASGETSLKGTIHLPKSLSSGKYYVFEKGVAYSSGMTMDVSLGGDTATLALNNNDFNKYWTTLGEVNVTSPSNTLSITLHRTASPATQKFLIRGIYITQNPKEVVFKNDAVMDLTYPTVMDNSPAVKGNVFENSDFEVGTGHGWALGYMRGIPQTSMWDTTISKYGKASLKIPLSGESSVYGDSRKEGDKILYSRIYTLKPNKKYTLSAWVKTDIPRVGVGLSLFNTFGESEQFAPPSGYPAQHKLATSATIVPGAWQRISISGDSLKYPTSDYQFSMWTNAHNSLNYSLWVDGIQLEEGDLTDYKPAHDVEIGLVTDRPGNIYFENESNNATLLAYNSTGQVTNKQIVYEVYDYLNKKVKEGSVNVTIPANITKNTSLNINPGKRGIFRIVFWIDGEEGTEEELVYSVVPFPSTMEIDESSSMGIHPNYLNFQLEELQRLGIKWARVLSPSGFFRWSVVEPVDNQFIWYDDQVQRAKNYGITTLGTLSTNNYWPAWASDPSTGFMKLDKWEEFVGQTVAHYSKLGVKYWEIWNEPNYTFPPAFYAKMMKHAVDAIEKNDPQAKIVGMGGAYKPEFFQEVIAEMERQYPNWKWEQHIDYLSTHQYPVTQSMDSVARYDRFKTFTTTYGTPIWNTEAGSWDLGFAKGPNSNFISFGKDLWGSAEADRYYRGSLLSPELTVTNFLHSLGNGQTKYFYYDSRIYSSLDYYQHHPTILEYDDTIRAKGIAYAIAGHFVDHSTSLGSINLNSNTFAYLFDKGGTPILTLWTKDLSAKSLSIPLSSSQINAYDIMGNPISAGSSVIPFGRTPIYIEGQGVSVSAFQTALRTATVSSRQDGTPPSISISEGPRGSISPGQMRMRWIALDEISLPGTDVVDLSIPGSDPVAPAINTSALLYSYRLRGSSDAWSSWSAHTAHEYTLENGSYTFEVRAKDQAGNISSIVNRTFTVGTGGGTVTTISGDFNHDGKVNTDDLKLLTGDWNKTNSPYDLNHDGIVNSLDYVIMAQGWTG